METSRGKPLIVQSDRTVFVEVDHPAFKETRDRLMTFAELEKSPEYVHIYRITPLSLWNAAAARITADEIIDFLSEFAKYPPPLGLRREIAEFLGRFGQLQLVSREDHLELQARRRELLEEVLRMKHLKEYFLAEGLEEREGIYCARVKTGFRGQLKVALIRIGYPIEDVA